MAGHKIGFSAGGLTHHRQFVAECRICRLQSVVPVGGELPKGWVPYGGMILCGAESCRVAAWKLRAVGLAGLAGFPRRAA